MYLLITLSENACLEHRELGVVADLEAPNLFNSQYLI
jgi:hypothetical protein